MRNGFIGAAADKIRKYTEAAKAYFRKPRIRRIVRRFGAILISLIACAHVDIDIKPRPGGGYSFEIHIKNLSLPAFAGGDGSPPRSIA